MDFVRHIFNHANSYGSRSSILSLWAWLIATLLASMTITSVFNAPKFVIIVLTILLVITLFAAMVAFFYCLFTGDTDALRSEKFNIEKLAIEKQVMGDNLTGTQSISSTLHQSLPHNSTRSIELVEDAGRVSDSVLGAD